MNGNSKKERIDTFIRREVRKACQEFAFDNPDLAGTLRIHGGTIGIIIASNISSDPYRFRELHDIMDWKKSPREK
jgi:hypothetical protein